MVKLLDLLSSVEVVEDGRTSLPGPDGNIGFIDLRAPVRGQRARVLRVDAVLVELTLLGVTDGVGGDCSKGIGEWGDHGQRMKELHSPFSPAFAIL